MIPRFRKAVTRLALNAKPNTGGLVVTLRPCADGGTVELRAWRSREVRTITFRQLFQALEPDTREKP